MLRYWFFIYVFGHFYKIYIMELYLYLVTIIYFIMFICNVLPS